MAHEVRLRLASSAGPTRASRRCSTGSSGTKLAIVSDKPQTTRTRILGVRNYPDAQVVFLDTPGIHRPLHRMNVRMVDAARRDDARRGRRSAWSWTPASRRQGRPVRRRADQGRRGAGDPHPEQDRSDEEDPAAADHRAVREGWPVRRDRADLGGDRRERGPPRAAAHRSPARGRGALPGRLPDRSAGALLRGRDRAREAAPGDARRDSVLRARWSSTSSRNPSASAG